MIRLYSEEDIRNDLTFQRFTKKKRGLAEGTIRGYVYALKSFCDFIGKSPTEIHDLHKTDLLNHVPEFNYWLTEALEDYVSNQIDEGYLYRGIELRLTRIKSFLHTFRLRPTPLITISMEKTTEDIKHRLTIKDIRKAIKHSKPTYQTIFTVQAQTGLSIIDVISLNIDDFIGAVKDNDEQLTVIEAMNRVKSDKQIIGCFDMRRKKTSNQFYTFIGHEALQSIVELLENRDYKYLVNEAPLFLREVSHLPRELMEKEYTPEEMRLKTTAVENYVDRMHDNSRGKIKKKGRKIFPQITVGGKTRNFFRTHKIRAWYSDQLRFKAGFSSDDVKYLMGQKTGDVLEHYIDTNNYKALKANYLKALPYLAINDEIIIEENQEAIDSLTKELQEERRKREVMEKRIQEMDQKNRKTDERLNEILNNPTVLEELRKR